MAEYGAPSRRVINGGGIPQSSPVLNQVYANVLNRPVLVPAGKVTGLGSAIFAFLAAGAFAGVAAAQDAVCPPYTVYEPQPEARAVYETSTACSAASTSTSASPRTAPASATCCRR